VCLHTTEAQEATHVNVHREAWLWLPNQNWTQGYTAITGDPMTNWWTDQVVLLSKYQNAVIWTIFCCLERTFSTDQQPHQDLHWMWDRRQRLTTQLKYVENVRGWVYASLLADSCNLTAVPLAQCNASEGVWRASIWSSISLYTATCCAQQALSWHLCALDFARFCIVNVVSSVGSRCTMSPMDD